MNLHKLTITVEADTIEDAVSRADEILGQLSPTCSEYQCDDGAGRIETFRKVTP